MKISDVGLMIMASLAIMGGSCGISAPSGSAVPETRAADKTRADLTFQLESERRSVRVGDSVGMSLRIGGPGLRTMLQNGDALPLDGFHEDAFVYRFRVRPPKEGLFVVGPYRLPFKGQSLQSNSVTLTVLPEWDGRYGTLFRVDRSRIALGESFELMAETWSREILPPQLSLEVDARFKADRSFAMNNQQTRDRGWTYACLSWEITPTRAGDFVIDENLFRDLPETVEPPELVVHVQGPSDPATEQGNSAPTPLNERRWDYGPPVVEARAVDGVEFVSMKDPSIVRYGDKWHLFCTVRGPTRSHAIVYLSFADFDGANKAERHILSCHPGYFCAPQVFYFTPQKKWYLICQAADEAWGEPAYRPAFATTADIGDPDSWTKLQPMFEKQPDGVKAWLDFWVICDDAKAHLFFTSLDGKMWRAETSLAEFPKGWSTPQVCLTGDIFEASHTYRLRGQDKYLTLVEAQNGHGWRYYKAYIADRLDGEWRPLAAGKDDAFASMLNVTPKADRWTDVVSHIELLRSGCDEKLEVDPADLRFVFQGCLDKDRQGKPYGEIPWQLGLMESLQ